MAAVADRVLSISRPATISSDVVWIPYSSAVFGCHDEISHPGWDGDLYQLASHLPCFSGLD